MPPMEMRMAHINGLRYAFSGWAARSGTTGA